MLIRVSVIDSDDLGCIRGAEDCTVQELFELLNNPRAEHKSAQPLVVGATFEGSHRSKAACLSRNVFPLDLDTGKLCFDQVANAFVNHNLQAVIHTTASHTEAKPKLRAFVILSRAVGPEEWPRVQAWAKATFETDPNAIDLPRISYGPMPIPGYECELIDGEPLDVDALPPCAGTTVHPPLLVHPPQGAQRTQDLVKLFTAAMPPMGHRHGFYLSLAGFCAKQQLPVSEAKALIVQLCTESGATDKIAERAALVDTTYAKHATGAQVAGENGLAEAMSHAVGVGADAIVLQASRLMVGMPPKSERETKGVKPDEAGYTATHRPTETKLGKTSLASMSYDLVTRPEWEGVLAFDLFSQRRCVLRKPPRPLDVERGIWTDTDTSRVRQWFENALGVSPSKDMAEQALDLACHEKEVNLVGEWLDSLPAKSGAIQELCETMGLTDPIEHKMVRKWLLSAVARAYQPGLFLKSALVIQGPQNAGKTGLLKALFSSKYYVSLSSDLADDKRVGELVQGAWVVELEEGHAVSKTDQAAMKRVLSLQYDEFRPAYGVHKVRQPRTCVFAVTTNADQFLDDETGNVRYYCVRVQEQIDLSKVEDLRDGVWAEARDAYKAGEAIWLTEQKDQLAAEEQAKRFEKADPLDEPLTDFLAGKTEVTARAVLSHVSIACEHAVKAGAGNLGNRIGKILRRLGCVPKRKRVEGSSPQSMWEVPPELAGQKQPNTIKTMTRVGC